MHFYRVPLDFDMNICTLFYHRLSLEDVITKSNLSKGSFNRLPGAQFDIGSWNITPQSRDHVTLVNYCS